ncbi:ABC transporter permease [Rhodococcus ruber BKS 20-38]|uniref:ABC transporter permease n=1 Tax=Rhodococcus ruber BKS 20-38 TaxID=1278076 RepID=M2Y5W5_9NOCA|nr:ABC transporter permease [Rhodococcus ruber]EME57000.1 ABC transporter permease [Rhodococcus ruber BKS 20-38]
MRVGFAAALIGLWQLVVSLQLIDRTVSSSPVEVWHALVSAVTGSELWLNLADTMIAAVLAFVLASVVGVVIGIGLALLPSVEKVVAPFLDAINAMPRIALAPVFVVAFGLSISSKIALAFSIVVFMVISAARAGVRSVDVDVAVLARTLGATRRQMFTKVLVPVAVPSIFGGLRLGLIYSILGVVTAELIASRSGVGQLLQKYAGLFQTAEMYAVLIVLAVVAGLINAGMTRLESALLRWQPDHS